MCKTNGSALYYFPLTEGKLVQSVLAISMLSQWPWKREAPATLHQYRLAPAPQDAAMQRERGQGQGPELYQLTGATEPQRQTCHWITDLYLKTVSGNTVSGFPNGHICPIKTGSTSHSFWQASNLVNYLNPSAVQCWWDFHRPECPLPISPFLIVFSFLSDILQSLRVSGN